GERRFRFCGAGRGLTGRRPRADQRLDQSGGRGPKPEAEVQSRREPKPTGGRGPSSALAGHRGSPKGRGGARRREEAAGRQRPESEVTAMKPTTGKAED